MNIHVTLICGSALADSRTLVLLKHIEALLKKKGVKTTLWNLQEKPLPVVDPRYHKNPIETPNERVKEFVKLIKVSDGIILGTPVYHGSFSGLLKNALDNLSDDSFRNKHVGLVSNAGGAGNIQACEHLRSIVRCLYGYTLQTQIATTGNDYKMTDNDGLIVANESIKKRCIRFADELFMLSSLMKNSPHFI